MRSQTSPKPKYYYVYNLISLKDKKFYTGFTNNLKKRLSQHLNGEVTSTKNRLPLKLLQFECYTNKQYAKAREVFLKSGFGRKQLKKSIQHTLLKYA